MSSKIYELLKEAIKIFYDQDAKKLLREGSRRASERCIVNRIAHHLGCLLQQQDIAADVDVEYNLDNENNDIKRIYREECVNNICEECWMLSSPRLKLTLGKRGWRGSGESVG